MMISSIKNWDFVEISKSKDSDFRNFVREKFDSPDFLWKISYHDNYFFIYLVDPSYKEELHFKGFIYSILDFNTIMRILKIK